MEGPLPSMDELAAAVASYEQAVSSGQVQRDPKLEAPLQAVLETFQKSEGDSLLGKEGLRLPAAGTTPAARGTSTEIVPEPVFVIKTTDLKDGTKVFVNVCGSSKVAAPGDWRNGIPPEVEAAMKDMESEGAASQVPESVRFPLSLSDGTPSTDNSGQPCVVYDVVLNSEVAKQAKVIRRLKEFVIGVCLSWVGHKHNRELDPKYKLPRSQYKGGPVGKHRIRVETQPLISEVKGLEEEAPAFALPLSRSPPQMSTQDRPPLIQEASEPLANANEALKEISTTSKGDQKKEVPKYTADHEGCPVTETVVKVNLPALDSAQGLSVYLQDAKLVIESSREYSTLEVPLLFYSLPSKATARFNASSRQLVVHLPLLPFALHLVELKAAAPHALGDLHFASEGVLDLE